MNTFEYIDASGLTKQAGSAELKSLRDDGEITPATPIRRAGQQQWSKAGQVKGLFPATQLESSVMQSATPVRHAADGVLYSKGGYTVTPNKVVCEYDGDGESVSTTYMLRNITAVSVVDYKSGKRKAEADAEEEYRKAVVGKQRGPKVLVSFLVVGGLLLFLSYALHGSVAVGALVVLQVFGLWLLAMGVLVLLFMPIGQQKKRVVRGFQPAVRITLSSGHSHNHVCRTDADASDLANALNVALERH